MNDLKKDAFAIATGIFLGVMFAHALGIYWPLGIVVGGAVGYLARLLTEPKRVASAAEMAWRAVAEGLPKYQFKQRVMYGFCVAVSLAGMFGLVLTVILLIQVLLGYKMPSDLLYRVVVTVFLVHAVATTVGFLVATCLSPPPSKEDVQLAKKGFTYFNFISIHILAGYYPLKGIVLFVKNFSFFARTTLKFTRLFLKFVHSEMFTACSAYSMVFGTLTFLAVPNSLAFILFFAVLGGIAGALVRLVVLELLQEADANP